MYSLVTIVEYWKFVMRIDFNCSYHIKKMLIMEFPCGSQVKNLT